MANFPSSVSTNANLYIAVNGLQTTLAVSCTNSDVTLTLTSTTGFPTTGLVTIDNTEIVSYTGVSGATITGCTRGADGTTAASHSLGVTVGLTVVAAHHNLVKDEVIAVETILGTTLTNAATPNATATSLIARDANVNAKINHLTENFSTVATAAGTTVLTVASSRNQQFTGSTTQTVTLPDCTTLVVGFQFSIWNRSSGAVAVNNNGGSLQQSIVAGAQYVFTCTAIGTANGTWDVSASAGTGTVTSVTGTTDQVSVATGTTTPVISIPASFPLYKYRRPNLVYSSSTVVSLETGIVTGTSGDASILFPDGTLRTETGSGRYQATTSQNAVFTNATLGNNQGGIRSGAVANNTWYACYAVKVTTFTANWVMVMDTVLPIQANYATLNSNFNASGWIYLGLVRYGDQGSNPSVILNFVQYGNESSFLANATSGHTGVSGFPGYILTGTAGATSLTYTYSAGTSGTNLPNNISFATYTGMIASSSGNSDFKDSGSAMYAAFSSNPSGGLCFWRVRWPASLGAHLDPASSVALDIGISGWTDTALGVGSNPLL